MINKRFTVGIIAMILSAGIACAEKITHNFQTMNSAGTLTFPENNKTGVTDLTTYTCTGGGSTNATKARFYSSADSGYQLSIFMVGASSATVETTEIADLDSITIYYIPDQAIEMTVSTQAEGGSWTAQTVQPIQNGQRGVKMPSKGNYKLKIQRASTNFYIYQIDYHIVPSCKCLRLATSE